MSLQFKKESVSLRTKIVQFNDDYGFVPTHDIHKVILLQSSKAYELTSRIYSSTCLFSWMSGSTIETICLLQHFFEWYYGR